MAARQRPSSTADPLPPHSEALNLHAAGIDVRATEHYFAVPVGAAPNREALAPRLAAQGLQRSQSALGAFLRRLKSRVGAPKAITATAHKLARLVYTLLKHGTAYVTQGMEEYEQRYRERLLKNLSRRAKELGCELVQPSEPSPEVVLA